MRRRKLATEIRQDQIAEAVLDLVTRGGLGALSVAAVARRVGVTPSALYRHFPSKGAMLEATLARLERRVHDNVRIARERAADPLEAVGVLLARHVELVRANRGIPLVLFSDDVYFRRTGRRARLRSMVLGYAARVADLMREGQRAGRIRRDLDPDSLGVMFLGLFQPGAILWHLTDGEFDIARQTQAAWKLFRSAIEAPAGAGRARRRIPRHAGVRASLEVPS
jgi:AcrR family transcriptional regulator